MNACRALDVPERFKQYGLDPTKDNVVFKLGLCGDDGIQYATEPIPAGTQYITTAAPKKDHPISLYLDQITSLLIIRGDDGKLEVTIYCKKS